jgi:hypothetical protein
MLQSALGKSSGIPDDIVVRFAPEGGWHISPRGKRLGVISYHDTMYRRAEN